MHSVLARKSTLKWTTLKAGLIAKKLEKTVNKQSHSPRSLQREQEAIAAVHEVPAF